MRHVLLKASEWAHLTGRHKLAVVVLLFWSGLSLKVFLFSGPELATAQTGNYSALTIGALGFAAALFGLTKWADVQMAQIPPAGVPG